MLFNDVEALSLTDIREATDIEDRAAAFCSLLISVSRKQLLHALFAVTVAMMVQLIRFSSHFDAGCGVDAVQ